LALGKPIGISCFHYYAYINVTKIYKY
jgi:hypothetical protein